MGECEYWEIEDTANLTLWPEIKWLKMGKIDMERMPKSHSPPSAPFPAHNGFPNIQISFNPRTDIKNAPADRHLCGPSPSSACGGQQRGASCLHSDRLLLSVPSDIVAHSRTLNSSSLLLLSWYLEAH